MSDGHFLTDNRTACLSEKKFSDMRQCPSVRKVTFGRTDSPNEMFRTDGQIFCPLTPLSTTLPICFVLVLRKTLYKKDRQERQNKELVFYHIFSNYKIDL